MALDDPEIDIRWSQTRTAWMGHEDLVIIGRVTGALIIMIVTVYQNQ
jgi:hypothetical protein